MLTGLFRWQESTPRNLRVLQQCVNSVIAHVRTWVGILPWLGVAVAAESRAAPSDNSDAGHRTQHAMRGKQNKCQLNYTAIASSG